jgi:hypothetical protein
VAGAGKLPQLRLVPTLYGCIVAPFIQVEPELLTADGLDLANAVVPIVPPVAVPPAADPVSQSVAAVLEAQSGALTTVVEHSGALRVHGGAVLAQTAAGLQAADHDNAAGISAVTGATVPAAAPLVAASPMPSAPPDLMLPETATMTALPVLPGDQLAALIHDGPGSRDLRDFAEAWQAHAASLDDLADQVLVRSAAIDEHWIDNNQRAGVNTREHGYWLRDSADKARTVADVADQFDTAKRATPTPEEFDHARREILAAQARRDPMGAVVAARRHAELNARAVKAAMTYHGGVTAAANTLGTPLQSAPTIARGGVQPLSAAIPGGIKLDGGDDVDPYTGVRTDGPQPVRPVAPPFDRHTGAAEGGGGAGKGRAGEPGGTESPPTKITGLTGHGAEQVSGRDGHGVNDTALQDAVSNPTQPRRLNWTNMAAAPTHITARMQLWS